MILVKNGRSNVGYHSVLARAMRSRSFPALMHTCAMPAPCLLRAHGYLALSMCLQVSTSSVVGRFIVLRLHLFLLHADLCMFPTNCCRRSRITPRSKGIAERRSRSRRSINTTNHATTGNRSRRRSHGPPIPSPTTRSQEGFLRNTIAAENQECV